MRKDFLDGNYAEKEVTLTIRVPSDFDREDERMLDDAISDLLYKNGYELVDSKEYRDISPERETVVAATFVSVWDGGFEIATSCKVNMTTGHVFDIEVSEEINGDNVDVLDDEFIRLPDGTEHHVCDPYKEDGGFFWYGNEEDRNIQDPLRFIFDKFKEQFSHALTLVDTSRFTKTTSATLCCDSFEGGKVVCVDLCYDAREELPVCDVVTLMELPFSNESVQAARFLLHQLAETHHIPVNDELDVQAKSNNPSLSDQIQSASTRAVEPQTSSQAVKQEFEPEI